MKTALAVFISCCVCVCAQTVTGTLEGRITDASGGVITGAEVTAKNADTGLVRVAKTNGSGYFQMTFLPIGAYDVTAWATGFGPVERKAQVELSSAREVDFEMKPASVDTAVTVTAESPQIDTSRGDLKSTIDEKAIEDRPLSSRNILLLVEQLPGFQSTGGYSGVNNPTLSSGSYVSFNGAGSRSVSFQIAGVNNDDSSEGTNCQNANISSIKQFQVLTNSYSAEFGRAGGAVVLVETKSGTQRPFDPGGSDKDSIGRNTFFGEGLTNLDLALFKSFLVREGQRLTFRAEAFGLTNSPHFSFPTASTASASFGRISGTYNPFNFVGTSRNDAASRIIQLALRYTF